MNKLLSIGIILLFLASFTSADVRIVPINEVTNFSFEDSVTDLSPWSVFSGSSGVQEVDPTISSHQSNSAKLTIASGNLNILSQTMTLQSGATYRLTGAIRTDLSIGSCELDVYGGSGSFTSGTSNVSGISNWGYYTDIFTVPNNLSTIQVRALQAETNTIGECWFDDVSVTLETGPNNPPTFSFQGDIDILENSGASNNLIDLFAISDDQEDADSELDYVITNQTNTTLIFCTIDGSGYLDCDAPTPNSLGSSDITVRVTDTDGDSASDSFRINVIANPQNTAPTIAGLPNIALNENDGPQSNIIDLFVFTSDNEDSDNQINYEITNQTNSGLINCIVDSSAFIDCDAPRTNDSGTSTVTVRVTDTGGLTDTDSFVITVNANPTSNEAPIISLPSEIRVDEDDGFQNNIIDLFDFTSDDNNSDSELTFSLTNETNPGLINCFIDQDRYVDCNAPRNNDSGTNTLTIRVTDTDGLTDTDTVRIEVIADSSGNDAPRLNSLPDVEIEENSGFSDRLINLWNYASDDEDSDSELDFRITSQSNTSLIFCRIDQDRYFECEAPRDDRTGFSTVFIEVEDRDGLTDREVVEVEVFSDDFGNSSCRDIDVDTRTIFMDESDTERVTFDIRNRSNDDFEITSVDVDESSSLLSVRDVDFDRFIDEDRTGEMDFELRSTSVSSDREVTVTIEIRGEFRNGRSCSFSDVGMETFRVRIDNSGSGSSSSVCRDIDLRVSDITVPENSERLRVVTIENSNSRYFTIIDVRARETNAYFSVRVEDEPNRVDSYDTERIELLIDTKSVSRDKRGTVEVQVSGRFSNGTFCSLSSITEEFDVTVDNRGTSSGGGDDDREVSGTVSIDFGNSFITLEKNQSRAIRVTLTNNLDDSQCFSLSTTGSSIFRSTLTSNNICLDERESETLTMNITATKAGSGNAQFKASYDGRSKSKFVSVEVLAGPTSAPIVDASIPSEISESTTIELQNRGENQENVSVSVVNLPDGVSVRSVTVPIWRTGDTLDLELEIDDDFVGTIDSTIRINSDGGVRSIPLELEVVQETGPTGFVGLATTAGLAIGLLIVVVLAIVGVLSVFAKK